MPSPEIGGRYRIVKTLGAGGMAEVFIAERVGPAGFKQTVAIKRILPAHADQLAFASLFINEAKIAAELRHENIVQVSDFDQDGDRWFLVMEYVEGCDLSALMQTGPLPHAVVVYIVASLLRGLAYAHDLVGPKGPLVVVHRDVSPHNCLLSWEGAVKVSDFGVAKLTQGSNVTNSGGIVGKPTYMAPEQARGEFLDGRADLFAVGIILWEMLTGRSLFGGGTLEETLLWVIGGKEIPRPRSLVPQVPGDLDDVTMTLLERDRDRRFQHARDAVAALDSCSAAATNARELLAS